MKLHEIKKKVSLIAVALCFLFLLCPLVSADSISSGYGWSINDFSYSNDWSIDGYHSLVTSFNGQVWVAPSTNVTLRLGQSQTLTFIPYFGYSITDVVVDSVSIGPVASYTFNNVSSSHTIFVNTTLNADSSSAGYLNTIEAVFSSFYGSIALMQVVTVVLVGALILMASRQTLDIKYLVMAIVAVVVLDVFLSIAVTILNNMPYFILFLY